MTDTSPESAPALPLRRLTLFQHGLGFFGRAGSVPKEFTLDVARRAMDDLLKSLTVIPASGTVRTVAFETPPDRNVDAQRASLDFDHNAPLVSLANAFVGHRVDVRIGNRSIMGTLVGIEREVEDHLKRAVLVVNSAQGVELISVASIERITLVDAGAKGDLAFALEEQSRDVERATARVSLSTPTDVQVHYTGPAPSWRVSYRVLIELAESKNKKTTTTSTARNVYVQGWGLFDNTLDEDLHDIELTLTAGMPVSFRYHLHEPNTPERPLLQDERRTVADAIEFADMEAAVAPSPAAVMMAAPAGGLARSRKAAKAEMRYQADADDMAVSAPVQATGESRGALFAYRISEPVSVRRGESGMVPIAEVRGEGSKELLYNPQKTPQHPSVSVRIKNHDLVLERGPATVFDNGEYGGEAVVPFTVAGGELVLAYAVELGVKVEPSTNQQRETRSISLSNGDLVCSVMDVIETKYVVESKLAEPQVVTIEHPRNYNTELLTSPTASSETEARFSVTVPARGKAELTVIEQRPQFEYWNVRSIDGWTLKNYLDRKLLDKRTYESISHILKLQAQLHELETERNARNDERERVRARLADVRNNLGVLDADKDAHLRNRFVTQLDEMETQLQRLDAADVEGLAEADRIDAAISEAIDNLT